MLIIVASKNQVKINAAEEAFTKMFPGEGIEVQGVGSVSGVSEQPLTNEETLRGARNRAADVRQKFPDAYFWVGIEGGIEDTIDGMAAFAWAAIVSRAGVAGQGKTGTFFLPPAVADLIHQGVELGAADDIVFGKTNSKQANGAVGLLTGDLITRTSFYVPAVILATIPLRNPRLYSSDVTSS